MMKKFLVAIPIVMIAAAGSTACATKKFVRTEVGAVNDKVTTLTGRMEESEQRIKANEAKIGEVDGKVGAVDQKVGQVDQKAQAAGQSAQSAQTAAQAADAKAQKIADANRKLVYGIVLSEASGGFKFSKSLLPDEAKGQLDKLVSDLATDPKAVFFTIEGHTDSRGSDDYNRDLSERRADAVRDGLVDRTIDAGRIRSVGLGETYPVASNDSDAGQQQNRRVEIVISDEQGAFPAGAQRTASRQ